jgi:hypothetical protein
MTTTLTPFTVELPGHQFDHRWERVPGLTVVGHRLGLYRALAQGPATPEQFAERTGNALRAPDRRSSSGWLFIDPDGFVADPAYDLGVVVRDWCRELLEATDPRARAEQLCRLAAEHGGQNEQAVWEWGYLERVSSGLFLLAHGMSSGSTLLETAAQLAR